MIKDRVGVVRTSTRNLPEQGFTYGKKCIPDPEGAGDVISNWITADPSASKETVRSHIHSNILAIKHGAVTAKAQKKFAEDHTHIKMKEILTEDEGGQAGSAFEGPFGIKTTFADETMENIIQAKYTSFSNDDADYPKLDGLVDKSALPQPRMTKASSSSASRSKTRSAAQQSGRPESTFVMKKFQNIPGKLNLPKNTSARKTQQPHVEEAH